MKPFPFNCPKCKYHNDGSSVDEIKLLKTVAKSQTRTLIWVIFTCPKCKETFQVQPSNVLYNLAPVTHISMPGYDVQ